MNKLQSNSRSW